MRLKTILTSLALLATLCSWAPAQTIKPMSVQKGQPEKLLQLTYRGTTLDQVLEVVRKITGRTIIMDPKVSPITINLVSEDKLSETDVLIAVETVLEMNNIVLIPQGDSFLQVVPADAAFQRPLQPNYEEGVLLDPNDESRIVSQVISLKFVTVEEVQPILQLMLHAFAKVQYLERANAILLVDSAYNIKRVMDVLKYIDRPNLRSEEPKIYQIKHAQATEVAAKLTELIAESQAENQQGNASRTTIARTPTSTATRTSPPGVIRARTTPTPAATQASISLTSSSDAEKGLINGKVQIVPDERTNIIIIISRPENFPFFDQMIEVLDIKVEPEITFKNIRLEFAIAEDIASLIQELIGAATTDSGGAGSGANRAPGSNQPGAGGQAGGSTQARSISDFIRSRNTSSSTAGSRTGSTAGRAASGDEEGNLGEISENTQVIADPRTNSIMIMGRKADIALLTDVIKEVDIMLDQVLIEAVILEVGLNDNISYGVDWLQRSLAVVDQQQTGPNGGITTSDNIAAFGSASRQNGGTFVDGATIDRTSDFADGALSIFGTYYDLNVDVVVSMTSGDSDARVLSTPVILTTDNTEANIVVGERRPIPTSTSQGINTGINQTNVDYENIGIELKVTPRINPQGFVVMEIDQKVDNVGGTVVISGDEFPIITTRQLTGSIAVQNRETIVLGGLVSEDKRDATTKVPILGDLPFLGTAFRSTTKSKNRTELLVLITPYVLGDTMAARDETSRLSGATKLSDASWHRQWSDSPLNPEKDGDIPVSRFRDGLSKNGDEDASPVFAPVAPESVLQVKETSRFQRPLLEQMEAKEAAAAAAAAAATESAPETTPAPVELELINPTPAPLEIERPAPIPAPVIPTPESVIPAPAPATKSFAPAPTPAIPTTALAPKPAAKTINNLRPRTAPKTIPPPKTPAVTKAPAIQQEPPTVSNKPPAVSSEPPAVLRKPPAVSSEPPAVSSEPPAVLRKPPALNLPAALTKRPAPVSSINTDHAKLTPPAASTPQVKRTVPKLVPQARPAPKTLPSLPTPKTTPPTLTAPKASPAPTPKTTAVPAPAINPAPKVATAPAARRIENNPAVKLLTPPTIPSGNVAPIRALQHQSSQKLILNSNPGGNTPGGTKKAPAKKVGDPVPEKDGTSQTKSSGWRGLFSSLR